MVSVGAGEGGRRLSIVIPTRDGWPKIEVALASVERAARRVGAEVIVADGSAAAPPSLLVGSAVRWIPLPGCSVFQLRNEGYRRARGAVVAVTVGGSRGATPGRGEWERSEFVSWRSVQRKAAENGAHCFMAVLVHRHADHGANRRVVEASIDRTVRAAGHAWLKRSNCHWTGPIVALPCTTS